MCMTKQTIAVWHGTLGPSVLPPVLYKSVRVCLVTPPVIENAFQNWQNIAKLLDDNKACLPFIT